MTIKEEIQIEEYKRTFAEAYKQGFIDAMSVCKTEPTISKMEQVEITADDFNEDDESCEKCRWFNPMKNLGCNLDDDECYYSPKDEPQTEMTTEQVVNELLSIKKILDDGKMPTDCAWGKDS